MVIVFKCTEGQPKSTKIDLMADQISSLILTPAQIASTNLVTSQESQLSTTPQVRKRLAGAGTKAKYGDIDKELHHWLLEQ